MPIGEFAKKLLNWGKQFDHFALYLGNEYPDPFHQYDLIFAAGAEEIIRPVHLPFDGLYNSWQQEPSWLFGYLAYDLKNAVESLSSTNVDGVKAPDLLFFKPAIVGHIQDGKLQLHVSGTSESAILDQLLASSPLEPSPIGTAHFNSRIEKDEYLEDVRALQRHIQQGNIYEINFCQEFFAEQAQIDPFAVFLALNDRANPPFAGFLNTPDHAVISASPERYLQKTGRRLVSQPIKGTAKRSKDPETDQRIKRELLRSVKERAENVMIVDLVRNDLSKVAEKGTVTVPELFGNYTFPTVHQLISTVVAELNSDHRWIDAIRESFPMGSMTGAPKVNAMKLAEKYELHKRGVYSGALGYITPNGDFDFNVVIRSLLYNKADQYLSASVGGAITILADAEEEYAECLLKAEALLRLFDA